MARFVALPGPRSRLLALLLGLLAVAPGLLFPSAGAHGGHDHGDTPDDPADPADPADPGDGSTVPPSELPDNASWYTSFKGRTYLGNASGITLPEGMRPSSLRAANGWLAWFAAHPEGGRNIYLHNVASDQGYWVTNDTLQKTELVLGNDYIVWKTAEGRLPVLRIHRISQGLTYDAEESTFITDLTLGAGAAYYTRRETEGTRIWTADLLTGNVTPFTGFSTQKREIVAAGDIVVWDDVSLHLADVGFKRLSTGEEGHFTRDPRDERRLVTDGRDFYWVVADGSRQTIVWRLDVSTETLKPTTIHLSDVADLAASDGLVVYRQTNETGISHLTLVNPRNGATHELVRGLRLLQAPVFSERVLYLLVETNGVVDIVRFQPHPITEKRAPTIVITEPLEYRSRSTPYDVKGYVDDPDGWGNLTAIQYRLGPQFNFTVLAPAQNFSFRLDPREYGGGNFIMQIAAIYADAPPAVVFSQQNFLPRSGPIGYTFEPLRNMEQPGFIQRILDNPGTLWTIIFLTVAVILGIIRVTLWLRHRPGAIEYVRPEDDEPIVIRGGPRPPARYP